MNAIQEVTEWNMVSLPNHIYLMDGDKAVAYIPFGHGAERVFSTPLKLDRSRRKFVELKVNPFKYKNSQSNLIEIKGSKGDTYFVDIAEGTCTCNGFRFRGNCRHIEQASH